jgi:hypothetical protein
MGLQKFYQLAKFDEILGIATGIAAAEEVDGDNEIMDYQGSKPYFQKWSASQLAASQSKSKGNVRQQHDPKRVVGKLTAINFDDENKQIQVSALIEDPVAKQMLASGTLTGFSVGGDYVSRSRPTASGVVRYVASPAELSVVDRPCMPSAIFSAVKADGSIELRKFKSVVSLELEKAARMAKQGFGIALIVAATGLTYHQVGKAMRGGRFLWR